MRMTYLLPLLSLTLVLGIAVPSFAEEETTTPSADTTTIQTAPSETGSPAPSSTVTEKPKPAKAKFSLNADEEALKLTDDIQVAEEQAAAHPNDPEANFLLAAAYSRSPYLDKAFNQIKKVKNILKAQKDFEFIDRKIGEYETLLSGKPNDPVILYRLAFAYYFKGYGMEKYPHHFKNAPTGNMADFYQKAQDTMRKVITVTPKDTWARNYLGYFVSDNGKDLSKAISIWQESLAINRDQNPGAYLLLSQAYLKQGDLQNAMIYGAKGLEVQQTMGMRLP